MFPWLWYWTPQLHLPFSGSVTQDISPDTNWFFGAIRPGAGIGEIEKEVFGVASYGRQLGLMMEVLLPLAGAEPVDADKAKESLDKLKDLYARIEKVKAENKQRLAEAAVETLEKLKAADPAGFERVLGRFRGG